MLEPLLDSGIRDGSSRLLLFSPTSKPPTFTKASAATKQFEHMQMKNQEKSVMTQKVPFLKTYSKREQDEQILNPWHQNAEQVADEPLPVTELATAQGITKPKRS